MEYKLITERSHLYCPNVHICFIAELTQTFDTGAVLTATGKTMIKHPVLRSYVRMDSAGNSYLHIAKFAEPEFAAAPSSGDEDWLAVVKHEQEKPFDLGRGPLFRLTCLNGKTNTTLVMCIHHILADGMSGMKILRDIAYFLKNPSQEAEPVWDGLLEDKALCPGEKLPPPLRLFTGWLNRRWRKSPHVFTTREYHAMHENYWRQNSHTIGIASLGQSQTDKLIVQCRENGVTVNTFLMAMLLKCIQEISGNGKANKKTGMAVSIHPNGTAIGNFASAMSIEYLYISRKSIWENTRAVNDQIWRKLGSERRKLFYLMFLKALDLNLIDSMYFVLFGGFKNGTGKTLGRLLGYVKNPKGGGITNLGKSGITLEEGIRGVYFVPPLVPSTDKIVGAVATDTGLRLVYQYDNHTADTNRQIFENWIEMIQKI